MAVSKLFFVLFLALIITKLTAEASDSETSDDDIDVVFKPGVPDSSLNAELHQLKSKISFLESNIYERIHELQSKDESIKELEQMIQERSTTLTSLQSEIQSLQKKGSLDANEQVAKFHAHAGELQKQVRNLNQDIETQEKKKGELEAKAVLSEDKIKELNLNLESLQRINYDQKARIRRTERALQVAEEELMKAKLEASYTAKELTGVQEAWLPAWLAVHLVHCQSFIVTQWNVRGRPALDVTIEMALKKKAQVERWLEPHVDTFTTKWIPIIKEQWFAFLTNIGPCVESLTVKTIDIYHKSKKSLGSHFVKVQNMMEPHIQETKKFTKPYIDQVSMLMKPHVDKAHVVLKPYTKKVLRTYRKFTKTFIMYHRQVQATIRQTLKDHELTKPLATDQIVWLMAYLVMALPLIFLFEMASGTFRKKPKKHARTSHTSHTRRRTKRTHPKE
ncbi:unnamed protein product [Ilex paraguariensis]|uniref:Uncharacterized protein n=1 Tax=Ilex paraguariensis TaxID=185542 RepID=A0ABC8UMQ5_9AQUA